MLIYTGYCANQVVITITDEDMRNKTDKKTGLIHELPRSGTYINLCSEEARSVLDKLQKCIDKVDEYEQGIKL